MTEGQESGGQAVAVLEKPVIEISTPEPNHTPLSFDPQSKKDATQEATTERPEPLIGTNSNSERDANLEDEKKPKSYVEQLNDLREQARAIVSSMGGKKFDRWNDIPSDIRSEINRTHKEVEKIFTNYFNLEKSTDEGKKIYTYLNPSLTPEDTERAQLAYRQYKEAEKKMRPPHGEKNEDAFEKGRIDAEKNRKVLEELKVVDVIRTFADNHFGRAMGRVFNIELESIGFPSSDELTKDVNELPWLRSIKDTDLIKDFFGQSVIEGFDRATYERMEKYLDQYQGDSTEEGRMKYIEALKALRQYPSPEANSILETNLYRDSPGFDDAKYAALEVLAGTKSPEALLHLLMVHVHPNNFFEMRNLREYDPRRFSLLQKLSQSPDWSALVDSFCVEYPELSFLKAPLQESEWRDDSSYSSPRTFELAAVKRAFKDYERDIRIGSAKFPDDKYAADLLKSVPTDIYIDDLVRNKLLTHDESRALSNIHGLYIPRDHGVFGELESYTSTFEDIASSPEERSESIAKLKRFAAISERVTKAELFGSLGNRGNLAKHEREREIAVAEPFHSFIFKSELTLEQVDYLLQNYKHAYDPRYHAFSFRNLNDIAKESEHYPLFIKLVLNAHRPEFVKQSNEQLWRSAFGEEAMKGWAENAPVNFIENSTKERWRELLGDKVMDEFLRVLPVSTDERRNAFLHNDYDRTTALIEFLQGNNHRYKDYFQLIPRDFEILTDYIGQFGLAKDKLMFHYFKQLSLLESGAIERLPADMDDSGINSKQELIEAVARMRAMAYGDQPMNDLNSLTSLELGNLRVVTGKASHRFDVGRPSFLKIIDDFKRDANAGLIEPVPEGYTSETLSLRDMKLEFNAAEIQDSFSEILSNVVDSQRLVVFSDAERIRIESLLLGKIDELDELSRTADGTRKEYVDKEVVRFRDYVTSLENVKNSDELMMAAVQMKMDKSMRPEMAKCMRRLVLQRLFEHSPQLDAEFKRVFAAGTATEITSEGILALVNLIKDPIREHVLDMKGGLGEYWSEQTVSAILENKDNIRLVFELHYSELVEAVSKFKVTNTAQTTTVRAIPDRGFIGEMSGYLADVCYTAEYPLLKGRNVVPYKFVTQDEKGNSKFIGSVLIFEVKTDDGEGALLVRGFDIPNESKYDTPVLFEKFLDQLVGVAKARGASRILVPGVGGAISNYDRTISHVFSEYVRAEDPVTLSDTFRFNNYDLTKHSYVAREVEASDSVNSTPLAA